MRIGIASDIIRIGLMMLCLRLIFIFFFLTFLSPGPAVQRPDQPEFIEKVSSVPGELKVVIQKSRNVLTLYKGMTPVKSYWAVFSGRDMQRATNREGATNVHPKESSMSARSITVSVFINLLV